MSKSLNILLVDDEDHLQEVLGLLLELDGHKVSTAFSGQEAIEKSKDKHFDLVITDLKMPGMSGMEVVKAFRENNPDTKIIMITGYPSEETEKEARELGVSNYIAKPFHMTRMREVIDQVTAELNRSNSA